MAKHHKPHSGSMAYYPRKRALKETPVFTHFASGEEPKPLNFYGYKAGMVHVLAKNAHGKSHASGQVMQMGATVIECPPLSIVGVRAYANAPTDAGRESRRVLGEAWAEKTDRHLSRARKGKAAKKKHDLNELLSKENISEIRLLAHTNPASTTLGKKKPALCEIVLGGDLEKQKAAAKEKLGGQVAVTDAFAEQQFVDAKAVTRGQGFTGVVKRFGIKRQASKAKFDRKVGNLGPWNPHTIMFTVARPGQHGYHTRTEYNKRVLEVGKEGATITPKAGFEGYGTVKNAYILVAGSVPGPVKRIVALRTPVRKTPAHAASVSGIDHISVKAVTQ